MSYWIFHFLKNRRFAGEVKSKKTNVPLCESADSPSEWWIKEWSDWIITRKWFVTSSRPKLSFSFRFVLSLGLLPCSPAHTRPFITFSFFSSFLFTSIFINIYNCYIERPNNFRGNFKTPKVVDYFLLFSELSFVFMGMIRNFRKSFEIFCAVV